MQTHSTGTGLPQVSLGAAQSRKFLPGLTPIPGKEKRGVFNSGIHGVRIFERWLQVPDALELPGMLGAIVPLVGSGLSFISEFVADRVPGFASVIGTLNLLPEPSARLRSIKPIRFNRRALNVPTNNRTPLIILCCFFAKGVMISGRMSSCV
jgi:hypothetical protein